MAADDVFLALFLISFLLLVAGLLRPITFAHVLGKHATRGKLSLIFAALMVISFVMFGGSEKQTDKQNYIKVLSVSGDQGQRSREFTVGSNDIKFAYSCREGLFVCAARLVQVGGEANKEIFHSGGSTGDASGETILSVGPGTFYITVNTGDRAYKIDAFQSSIPASEEDKATAEKKISEAEPYRSVAGFKMTQERTFGGDIYFYDYETSDGRYRVALTVNSPGDELEESYSLDGGSTEVSGVNAVYGFQEAAVINGVQVSQPYEAMEFIFKHINKTHRGSVRRSNHTPDKAGLEATMRSFVTALVSR